MIRTWCVHGRQVKGNRDEGLTTQNMETYIIAVEVPDACVMEDRGAATRRVRHVRIPGYAIFCLDFNEASYRVVMRCSRLAFTLRSGPEYV